MLDLQPLEPARRCERGREVDLSTRHRRDAHAGQFVGGDDVVAGQRLERVVDRAQQGPEPDFAVVADGHRHHHQASTRTQLAPAERDELMPVVGGLPGERGLHLRVGAVRDVHVAVDLGRCPAQPLDRPRAPTQMHAVGRQDLAVERAPHRRGERRRILAQVGVRVLLDGAEHRGEIVVRDVGVRHQHRMLGAGAAAQHLDRGAERQQRIVAGAGAVVGEHDRLRGGRQRNLAGGAFEHGDRRGETGGLQSRGRGVGLAVHRLGPHDDAGFRHRDLRTALRGIPHFRTVVLTSRRRRRSAVVTDFAHDGTGRSTRRAGRCNHRAGHRGGRSRRLPASERVRLRRLRRLR